MDAASITEDIFSTFSGVDVVFASAENGAPEIAWGDTFFIYDPNRDFEDTRRFPFATIVTKDYGDFDNASNLDRHGLFRLNIGVSKKTFAHLFGAERDYDFTARRTSRRGAARRIAGRRPPSASRAARASRPPPRTP